MLLPTLPHATSCCQLPHQLLDLRLQLANTPVRTGQLGIPIIISRLVLVLVLLIVLLLLVVLLVVMLLLVVLLVVPLLLVVLLVVMLLLAMEAAVLCRGAMLTTLVGASAVMLLVQGCLNRRVLVLVLYLLVLMVWVLAVVLMPVLVLRNHLPDVIIPVSIPITVRAQVNDATTTLLLVGTLWQLPPLLCSGCAAWCAHSRGRMRHVK